MTRALAFIAALLLAAPAWAHGAFEATYRSNYDGDTIRADIHLPLGGAAFLNQPIRLQGFDTPELAQAKCAAEREAAEAARAWLTGIMAAGPLLLTIGRPEKDGRGRWLARAEVGGVDVAQAMIAAGHGRPNSGERRAGWCP